MFGPVIQGALLRLRPPREAEAEAMPGWFEDMEVTRFIRMRFPPTPDAEREWLRARAADPDCVIWAIEVEARLVGMTGIHEIDWRNRHASTGTLIGDKSVWRRGVAGEMMRLRTRFAFRELNLHKLTSSYLEGNEGSGRAQERAGYRVIGRLREQHFREGRWHDEILTEVLREDWEAAQAPS